MSFCSLKFYIFYCRDEKPKIKKAQLSLEEKVQEGECNIFLWMSNTPAEQTELEPSAQSLAVRLKAQEVIIPTVNTPILLPILMSEHFSSAFCHSYCKVNVCTCVCVCESEFRLH